MNLLIVIALGGMLGYWIVSLFFPSKPPPRPPEPPPGRAPTSALLSDWPRTLGVSARATPDEIRSAYKSLMSQYHPDKVASLGIELRELAESKSKEIGAAYQAAMRERGLEA